ncbi:MULTISPECIES: hypothetical protein [Bacillus]|uniref:Uncharacterized protein n=2 Tax=Bacillus TaxID=1386 RepID=A0A0M4FKQ4_9BACI|nr:MULTISPECIES: hypothetical protein [Bacillus]ALC82404.1 hypothetical protein AM592_13050 [Bacillus gobiensis]MBP1081284.1 hypothetical protein [Bacillus capparidis]MED1095963.1 hypothetical protein [Bacillus capparidis]
MRKWLFLNYTLLVVCLYLYFATGFGAALFGIVIFLVWPVIHGGKTILHLIKKPSLKRKGS